MFYIYLHKNMKTIETQINIIQETIKKIWKQFHKEVVDILFWFNTFLNYHFFYWENRLFVNQWDIYEVNLWRNVWSELNKKRPCVVISSDPFNSGNTIVVAPIKSIKNYSKNWVISVFIDIDWTNLEKESFVSISNIREVSKRRLVKKIWKIKKEDMVKVKKSLSVYFRI